jgi:hypothetical protein
MGVNSVIWKGGGALAWQPGPLVATPDSNGLKFAERISYTERLAGRFNDAFLYARSHYRGSVWTLQVGTGFAAKVGYFSVEDSSVETEKGGKGVVTVNYQSLDVMPPEEFALTPFEIQPPILKNVYFASLTEADRKKARAAFNAATAAGNTSITAAIEGTVNKDLTKALVNKWLKGEENFYLAGLKFQHTLFSFMAPAASPGGFIQFPFGTFSGYVSAAGMSWLRQSDEVIWNNGLWKLTRTWMGAPSGQWDTDLYPTA